MRAADNELVDAVRMKDGEFQSNSPTSRIVQKRCPLDARRADQVPGVDRQERRTGRGGAGRPTCDSADIMYEDFKYPLPLNLSVEDRLYWFSTGAYTSSYSAVEFNGFPPLKSYLI
jgi:hypothetical protein